jgi:isocitrate dehydrogenase (NAD+)
MTKTVTVIPGQGVANPTGLLLFACLLLDHVEQPDIAERIRTALDSVVRSGEARTQDKGGGASTADFTAAVVRSLS